MKKTIISAMILLFAMSSFSQQTNLKQTLTLTDYLKKSKNQKTAAWILLGGGTALIVTGLLIGTQNEASLDNAATGGVIVVAGAASVIGSIPLFIASGKNKRRGMAAVSYFKMVDISAIQGYRIIHTSYPALSVNIRL